MTAGDYPWFWVAQALINVLLFWMIMRNRK